MYKKLDVEILGGYAMVAFNRPSRLLEEGLKYEVDASSAWNLAVSPGDILLEKVAGHFGKGGK